MCALTQLGINIDFDLAECCFAGKVPSHRSQTQVHQCGQVSTCEFEGLGAIHFTHISHHGLIVKDHHILCLTPTGPYHHHHRPDLVPTGFSGVRPLYDGTSLIKIPFVIKSQFYLFCAIVCISNDKIWRAPKWQWIINWQIKMSTLGVVRWG